VASDQIWHSSTQVKSILCCSLALQIVKHVSDAKFWPFPPQVNVRLIHQERIWWIWKCKQIKKAIFEFYWNHCRNWNLLEIKTIAGNKQMLHFLQSFQWHSAGLQIMCVFQKLKSLFLHQTLSSYHSLESSWNKEFTSKNVFCTRAYLERWAFGKRGC